MITNNIKGVLIVDLDRTLISTNSMHKWIVYIIKKGGPVRIYAKIIFFVRMVIAVLERLFNISTHGLMKRKIQNIWQDSFTDKDIRDSFVKEFSYILRRYIDPSVYYLFRLAKKKGWFCLLSTAAPVDYAYFFGIHLGFHAVSATPFSKKEGWEENIGKTKLANSKAILKEKGLIKKNRIVITDHIDDLPLIKESQTVIWCGLRSKAPKFKGELFFIEELNKIEIYRILKGIDNVRSESFE